MSIPSPSRFARSLVAAAALLLAAAPASAAPPQKATAGAPSPGGKGKDDKTKGAKADAKADTKSAKVGQKNDAKADAKSAKADAKVDAKSAKADAKADAKSAKADAKSKTAKKDESAKKGAGKGASSIGAPNKGKLAGAVKLRSSRSLKVRDRAHAWALPDLVKLLQRAAGKVAKRHPKSVMLVGDLSRKTGGELLGHNSHQSGRDADVGLYVANSKGKPAPMTRFVAFDGEGKSESVKWAQFDDARNWALVEALLTDTITPVRYIFVSNPLRARLIAYAKKKGADKDLLARAALVMLSPRDADVHDDHFHVRIACPESMKGTCIEESIVHAPAVAKGGAAGAKAAPAAGAQAKKAAPAGANGSAGAQAKPAPADASAGAQAKPAPADAGAGAQAKAAPADAQVN